MFRAYLGEPERYAKCFRDGWYLTGDLARRDADGYFWFVGRGDDVIKTSGHLIGPFEVESVLLEHPAVAEAGVIGKPDPVAGEIVKAFVTLKRGLRAVARARAGADGARARRGSARSSRRRRSSSPTIVPQHAQRQDHAPPAEGARARPARGRRLDAGGRGMTADAPHRRKKRRRSTASTRCALLREMLRIRRFEEKAAELYSLGKIRGFLHLYIGEEACAVGAMQALGADDRIVATYRDHGHALARGLPMGSLMAEMYGKATGCSRGRGGSMHFFDVSRRFYGGYAIVGGGLPIAVGLALADAMQGNPRVTACFFGDGAVVEGEFHESLNLAALWKPAGALRLREQPLRDGHGDRARAGADRHGAAGPRLRHARGGGRRHGRARRRGGGAARRRGGPQRRRARTSSSSRRIASARTRWPTPTSTGRRTRSRSGRSATRSTLFVARLREQGLLDDAGLAELEATVAAEIDEAVAFAEAGPWEPVEDLRRTCTRDEPTTDLREAIRAGMREALASDERVFLMGEDVGRYGGAFAVSMGLLEEFGPERDPRHAARRSRRSSAPASARRSTACARSSRS